MSKSKVTSKPVASKASKVMQSSSTGAKSKSVAASALSQTGAPKKQTSSKVASAASQVLRDGRTSQASKSAAASALSQTPSKRK
jgi:hypothetical protein